MMKKTIALGLLAASLFCVPVHAERSALELTRAQLMRLHIRLYSEASTAPEVVEAQRRAGAAYTEMYKHREEVLTRLYQRSDYKDLRLALYHTQRKLSGVREEIPVRIQKVMAGATDAMAIRVQITRLEAETLEADPDYVEVRDIANALNAEYRQALRTSLDSIRTNPELVALCDQIAEMQRSVTGMRAVTARD